MVELRSRGVVFEGYDLPDLKTVNGMAEFFGNYAPTVARVNVARGCVIVKEIYWPLGQPILLW